MISYSQNFEDVILARALQKVEIGFYVDLGASDSTLGSVTKHFYDNGWSGINVEPNPSSFKSLAQERPRDINLNVGISANPTTSTFYCITENQLSTFDRALGEGYLREFPGSYAIEMEMLTTENLARQIRDLGTEVHFLKVDIEGQEAEVINSWRFDLSSPWIVVIEATIPRTRKPTHHKWERSLLDAGYSLIYEDGLNRFYLHASKRELEPHFQFPPNIFDSFITASELNAINSRDQAAAEKEMILDSLSWKLTAPLRFVLKFLKLI